jgi:hypothetical protein
MKIISTYYQHKIIHKETWISPDSNTLNQIDHVIIDAKKEGRVKDVRTMLGWNYDSSFLSEDHNKAEIDKNTNLCS